MRLALTFAALLALGACATSEQEAPKTADIPSGTPPISSPIISTSGASIGTATFTASPHGVLIRIMVDAGGLTPGWHGAHFHEVGACADTEGFRASGVHVHKDMAKHGLLYPYGPENGDLPNISAAGDGSAAVELFSSFTTLSDLQDADGSALVIHASADDHLSQPIGGAGDRIACAVVKG